MLFTTQIPLDSIFILQESEVSEVRWITLDELRIWASESPHTLAGGALDIWRTLGLI